MAKTIGILNEDALRIENSQAWGRLVAACAQVAVMLRAKPGKDVERFVRHRGGIMSDGIEREIARHFGRM